jgi:hypothetical protein
MSVFDETLDGIDLENWVEDQADGSKRVTLEYPTEIKVNTGKGQTVERVESLVLRRPKGRELDILERAGSAGVSACRKFAASMIVEPEGLAERHVGDLDAVDSLRVVSVALSFLPLPHASKAGETPQGL